MLLGQVTKALKKWHPLCFFCMFQKFLRMNQKFAPLEGQVDSKCFWKLGFNFLIPPKKIAKGPMPAKHWKECLVLVQKGMAGLSRTILQDGVLCKVNVKLSSPLRKNIQVFSP